MTPSERAEGTSDEATRTSAERERETSASASMGQTSSPHSATAATDDDGNDEATAYQGTDDDKYSMTSPDGDAGARQGSAPSDGRGDEASGSHGMSGTGSGGTTHHSQHAMHPSMKDAGATAMLTSVSPAAKIDGMVGIVEKKNGAKLIIHIDDAEPGRYAVQILDSGVGTCSTIDDTRGTEETTGGGMTSGSKGTIATATVLGHVDVKKDRTGHREITLTQKQIGGFDSLEQKLVVIREDKANATADSTAQGTGTLDAGAIACGAIEMESAG